MPHISPSGGRQSWSIEDCRGDFEEVSSLVERSWAENTQQGFLYQADFLASCFEYPGASFSLAPAIYDGATPLAFAAAFPRRASLNGRELKLVVVSFLTVARELKKRGYGILLWKELVSRARLAGFDGMVNYCVEGESMNRMILGCCRMLHLPEACSYTIPHWSRVLQPRKVQRSQPELPAGVVERFIALV